MKLWVAVLAAFISFLLGAGLTFLAFYQLSIKKNIDLQIYNLPPDVKSRPGCATAIQNYMDGTPAVFQDVMDVAQGCTTRGEPGLRGVHIKYHGFHDKRSTENAAETS